MIVLTNTPSYVALLFLSVWLSVWLKKILHRSIAYIAKRHQHFKNEYALLVAHNDALKQKNADLKNALEKIIALYENAKQICKYLEEEKVFAEFKNHLYTHIEIRDCQFIKGEIDISKFKGYIVLPLEINKAVIGSLVADGIRDVDNETFQILSQQFLLAIKRAILYQKVNELAITDGLTQVLSRRYWFERFSEELERSKKLGHTLSCLMIDIDHFKEYNDQYGHLVGDSILKEVSRTIKENIREIDIMGRYGGEEFCVVLTETEKEDAGFVANRILQAVQQRKIVAYDETFTITISIGIAMFPGNAQECNVLIDKADKALYEAKRSGRNKVCAYLGE
ncbi:MAG: GGDEF domain-containing protein [Candidatus Omnitrophica bacterium]|nr:GGDEF domain-containing protein [Candidatus Omnitrophota bacterium]